MQDIGQPARGTPLAADTDRLWVPLLTHWRGGPGSAGDGRDGGTAAAAAVVDAERMAAHVRAIAPWVRQFMLAASTGDGWDIGADAWSEVVRLSRRVVVFAGTRLRAGNG